MDTPQLLAAEIKAIEAKVMEYFDDIKAIGIEAQESKNIYDEMKHKSLVDMFYEEAVADPPIKRTEVQRSAIYRTKLQNERTVSMMDARKYEIAKEGLRAACAVLNAMQTRARLLKTEMELE